MDHFIARRFHCSCWQIFAHMPSLTFRIIIGVELFIRVAAIAILGSIPCSPYITNPKNGKCYRKYCDLQEAASASEMCRYRRGELVTICDKDDNDLIAGLAILHPDHLDVLNSVWIGLVRNYADRSQWQWLSGENCAYRSWFGNEPNDMGGNENHVHMNTKTEHYDKWNDISLSYKLHYICEWTEEIIVDGE
ncbi:hypothetical protein V3C99_014084 [Haemonchus contortus]